MTVEPVIFRLGSLEVSGFGLLVLAGFIAGAWVIRRELLRRGLAGDYAGEFFIAAAIGGLLGAKLWYAALFRDPSAFFERSGMVWWGGLSVEPWARDGSSASTWRWAAPSDSWSSFCEPRTTVSSPASPSPR